MTPLLGHSNGQDWLVSWHDPRHPPSGRAHGAAGVCVGGAAQLVLISNDGVSWDFPAGRPEGAETIEETLRREMREEACVRVDRARLLGFARSRCVAGPEEGLVLVRSFWRAEVTIEPWDPQFEITHRLVVPATDAARHLRLPDAALTWIALRALAEAGLT